MDSGTLSGPIDLFPENGVAPRVPFWPEDMIPSQSVAAHGAWRRHRRCSLTTYWPATPAPMGVERVLCAALHVCQPAGNHGSGHRHRLSSGRNSLSEINIGSRWRGRNFPVPDRRRAKAAHENNEDQNVNAKLFVVLFLLGAAVLFIIQNVAVVEIQFLFWSIQMSRSLLMFLLLAVGILIGWFLHAYMKHRRAR